LGFIGARLVAAVAEVGGDGKANEEVARFTSMLQFIVEV
jgi:uncharacterized protein YggU (UPF0235/DUF167 family)